MTMAIVTEDDLAKAIQEYQTLSDAQPGTVDAQRRIELDAAIKAYHAQNREDLRPARPEDS